MSAYIVNRETIHMLIESALAFRPAHSNFTWYDAKHEHQVMPSTDRKSHNGTGQMLWNENIESVQHRYPGEALETLPGTIGGTYSYEHVHMPLERPLPGECFAAIDEYEYQSCEHPGWHTSSAKAFCERLRRNACKYVTGYDK